MSHIGKTKGTHTPYKIDVGDIKSPTLEKLRVHIK